MGNLALKGELGSGGRESSSGESEGKSSKGVSCLGKRMEGSSVGPGFGCSGGTSERGEVRDDDDSFLDAGDPTGDSEAVETSKDARDIRLLTSVAVLLQNPHRGSGHSSFRKRVESCCLSLRLRETKCKVITRTNTKEQRA
jgi:hypothetical protein